jgi:hypothetical protein
MDYRKIVWALSQEWEELKHEYFDWLEYTEQPLNMTQWALEYKAIIIKNRRDEQ